MLCNNRIVNSPEQIDRPFPVVCLSWDALAGPGAAGAAAVRSRLERLTALGVDVAVLGPATLEAVESRLRVRPGVEGRLFFVLSHGAEVYSVGPSGPRLIERRQPSEREEQQLAEAAEAARLALAARGLPATVTPGRLGRRVLDLLPGRRGPNGTAARRALEERLKAAGFKDLSDVMAVVRRAAREHGLTRPVMTTDGRRVTFGLTGPGDAARWVARNLVADRGRSAVGVLVLGREFGRVGGVERAGRRLLVPELDGAAFVSLAEERDGIPASVLHLGGGAVAVLSVLDGQIEFRERVAREGFPEPEADESWLYRVEGFDPFREREVETWLTVANGESGTRGAIEEGSAASTPATFIAGVFGDGTGDPPVRQPVPAPDWTCLRLRFNGGLITLSNGEILEHRRTLDMKHGLVLREWRQRERSGHVVRVRTARFASLDDRSIMGLRAEAAVEDGAGVLQWEGCLGVSHAGGPARETAVESLEAPGFVARTRGRHGGGHAMATITRPAPGSPVVRRAQEARDVIGGWLEAGEPATVDRLTVVTSARTTAPAASVVRGLIEKAQRTGFDELLRRHREAWERLWERCDIDIQGDDTARLVSRFAMYHMLSTVHPLKPSVSIGARGLSGMSYFCHVFWDTEVFVVPFFIYTWPEAARTLLAYRYHNLPGARQKARTMGHRGALFPWESADTGEETTPPYGIGPGGEKIPILSGFMEHHISADVAWAVWEYWMATADDEFMLTMGAELLLETARFWASRAGHSPDGKYHIRLVVGPDEYHESVDDNAYTNVLARWNIRHALTIWEWLKAEHPDEADRLYRRLALTGKEMRHWQVVADNLVDGFDPQTGLYEQFAGFYELDDLDPKLLQPKPLPADLLLGREVTHASKVVKQADVVMLCHMLAGDIPVEVARANYNYYEPVTVHGSSLSPAIHAAVAARLGLSAQAMDQFRLACAVDLADNMGNAARGVHMATMGGIWQAVVQGFGGVRRYGDALSIDPHLPADWSRLAFPFRFRGATLYFTFEAAEVGITVEGAPLRAVMGGAEVTLNPGQHRFQRQGSGWVRG
jgi:kojibiose phosphorylase